MNKLRPFFTLSLCLASLHGVTAVGQEATADRIIITATQGSETGGAGRVAISDTAALLSNTPGVSLNAGGGISSLPAIHGMADDRLKIVVDGMQTTSACANHMNPPLSYVAPADASGISVIAGITPVSLGGDSIGGTILVDTSTPVFASGDEKIRKTGEFSAFSRSVNSASGASIWGAVATSDLSIRLSGGTERAGDYRDGHGEKVTSTYFEDHNVGVELAARNGDNLWVARAGHQSIPRQGFVNQQMDMVSNHATYFNLAYLGQFSWAKLDAKIYWQNTQHEMNLGEDKQKVAMMLMPMDTHGRDTGYSLRAEIPLSATDALRIGHEFHRFRLDDWWPPVPGSEPWMAPDTFLSINDGHRDQVSLFAEWESRLTAHWTSSLGLRSDEVRMNTGKVHGYSTDPQTSYPADAAAFNAMDHSRSDSNWDLTALARYEESEHARYEIGYARKTRSPNLYERYAWPTDWMSSGMINWFGDGNYYVGNPDLKPEVANTLSATADWHDGTGNRWKFKATPYYTYVDDFIGVDVVNSGTWGSTFNQLRFANHDAKIYGLDLSGAITLWDSNVYGLGRLEGVVGYVRGKQQDTGANLYHMMPLNAQLTLEQKLSAWTNTLQVHLVERKTNVDPLRREPVANGYALVDLMTQYQRRQLALNFGVTNLFNKYYALPLGGVNFDKFYATSWSGLIGPVAGQGRSVNVGLTAKF